MRSIRRVFLSLTVAALMAATAVATAVPAVADVFPSGPSQYVGGGALVVHIGNETCVTHFKDFVPTKQTGGCD